MCLIVFAYRSVPGFPVILAANRDEFYERPAAPAHFWKESPELLAGKDLKEGGTWLGIHKSGRYAALTNYRNMGVHEKNASSRGHLVTGFLRKQLPAEEYLENLKRTSNVYNGYNLLAGDNKTLCHYSNISGKLTELTPGIHGISNALINTPWQKVEKTKRTFKELADKNKITESALFHLLLDKERAPVGQLPDTGLPVELERAVSAPFIQTREYGTRCSTLLFIREDGEVRFMERTYLSGTDEVWEEKSYSFRIEPSGS